MTISDIYNDKILQYAGNIPNIGRLQNPHGSYKAHSKLCGSTVIVDVKVEDGMISEYAHDVKACALGQASSAIMAQNAVGCEMGEIEQIYITMNKMLKENGKPPSGKFDDLKFLEPVKEYKARHASTLLVFQATLGAMKEAMKKNEQK